MIDFELSKKDREVLGKLREEALVARRYARYYDENEHEFPPDELPEAAQFPDFLQLMAGRTQAGQRHGRDEHADHRRRTPGATTRCACGAARAGAWATPRCAPRARRSRSRSGQGITLAMAITEPGCGSDPSRVQTSAVLDGDEWVLNGEKIFVTTGCRAEGVVVWATIDKSRRPRRDQVVPGREGDARASSSRTRRRSSGSAPTTRRPTSSRTAGSRAATCWAATRASRRRAAAASRT